MEKNNKIILGLDISTHCTGVSIAYIDENGKVVPIVVTHLRCKLSSKIKGIESLFLKCDLFIDKLKDILIENKLIDIQDCNRCLITDVIIEEPLLSSNNKNTVATLLRYNGMIAYRIYELLSIVPKFISSYNARKYAFPDLMAVRKFNKKGEKYDEKVIEKARNNNEVVLFGDYPFDCEKKLILWNKIAALYPNIEWVMDKNGELKKENFDASDSLICVLGYVNSDFLAKEA